MSKIRISTRTDNNGKDNEDSLIAIRQNDRAVLCVADGVGGTDAGEIASRYITKTLETWLQEKDVNTMGKKTTHRELTSLVTRMHEDLLAIAEEKGGVTMGSTLTLAVVGIGKVVIENIGDSRTYVCQQGCCRQITLDQTVENYERVTGDEVDYVEEDRKAHTLMQSIGFGSRVPRPMMYEVDIAEDVDILLCSDGLSNTLGEHEIQAELQKRQSGTKVLQNLIAKAKSRGETDNITAVLYRRRKDQKSTTHRLG